MNGIRVSELFYLLLMISTAGAFFLHPEAGLPYMLCAGVLAAPLFLMSVKHPYRFFLLFTSISFYLAYLLRPLVLLADVSYFKYSTVAFIGKSDIVDRLYELSILMSGVIAGILVAIYLVAPKERINKPDSKSLLVDYSKWIVLVGWGALAVNLALAVFFRIGLKNVEVTSPHFQFILRLVPTLLMISSCSVLLIMYRKKLSSSIGMCVAGYLIAAGCFELLVRGSKAGLALIFFSLFVVVLTRKNDFQISFTKAVTLGVAFVLCCLVTFSLSNRIRYGDADQGLFERAVSAVSEYSGEVNLADSVDDFTGRMCGFDGQLVVQISRPSELRRSFVPTVILRNTIARIVPGMSPATMTTGKAIAVHYNGADRNAKFSGGVGIFGTLTLMSYGNEWLGSLIIGFLLGMIFRLAQSIRDPGIYIVFHTVFFYYIAQLMISGGIGFVLAHFVIVMGQAAGLLIARSFVYDSRPQLSATKQVGVES